MATIIPSVFADAVNEKIGVNLTIGQLATDVTDAVADITTCGNKVNFPTYDRVAKVAEVTKGTAMTPAEVSMTGNEEEIKVAGGSIRVYDVDDKQIKGSTVDAMAQQLADAVNIDLDTAIANKILAKATHLSPVADGSKITNDELLAGYALFGDQINADEFAGIVVNSRLIPSLLANDYFTSKERSMVKDDNGIVRRGLVGYWMGIPVFVANNGTYAGNECLTMFIKRNAVGYVMQKKATIEAEREAKLLATDYVVSDMYATSVLDDTGIVICRKTVA